ncbi:MAG TPA: ABC transporter permease [Gemmatimonadaceae bacterium]|jgi:putative ABC transport system permease protein|nr:ABC transporter permease [Gemmatimonadaceae bacterium]
MKLVSRIHSLGEGVLIALDAIRTNKVRAGLTILGIAVGVFVVTAMAAGVHGINEGVSKSFEAAGPTTFYVTRWPIGLNSCDGSADSCPWRHHAPLTINEAATIATLPTIHGVIAHVGSGAQVKYHDRNLSSVNVDAYTAGWTEVDGGDISPGRSFTENENTNAEQVIIINDKMKESLFDQGDAVGKIVAVDGKPFTVIGLYHPLANFFSNNDKPGAIIPFETGRRKLQYGVRWLDLTVKPKDGVARDEAMDEVTAALRIHRHLRPAAEDTWFLYGQDKVMELYDSTVQIFFIVVLTLSAVGLLVGGVGVIAIMMISVTERTREIGVRKALGATKATILWQFLVEAATLTVIGAMTGLVIGSGLAWAIRANTSIDARIPPLAIVAALLTSAITGVLFGLLPAFKAARLDPVEALRYE